LRFPGPADAASERVLARAGFAREGIVRSMPKPDGRRIDKTLYSLLPGE
jgi:RimJ/RimL family protein N-acetyltransferase